MLLIDESLVYLNEYTHVLYNGTEYAIAPYNDSVPHDTRLKIVPSSAKGNKRTKINSFRIEKNYRTVDDSKSHQSEYTKNKEYKEMRDLACALAQFDYETISNSAENTKSEDAMNKMLKRFELLSDEEIESLVKKGNEERIKLARVKARKH